MTKQLSVTALALLMAGASSSFAGTEPARAQLSPVIRYQGVTGHENITPLYRATPAQKVKGTQKIQDLTYTVVDSLINAFSFFSQDAQPFIYKPSTGTLAMIHRGASDLTTTPGAASDKDNIYITASDDWGMTWPTKFGPLRPEGTILGARYPSVYLMDPSETSPTFIYSFPLVVNPGATGSEWAWGDVVQGILEESAPDLPFGTPIGPISAGGNQYKWSTDSKITSADEKIAVIVGSVTVLGSPASENNAFGLRRVDLFGDDPFLPAVIPPQWRSDQFTEPTGTGTSPSARTSSISGLDHDSQGSIYLGIAGIFKDNNTDSYALPAVSKSSDNGATWTAFEACPASVINNYGASINAFQDSIALSFAIDFAVTGPDNFSFVTNFSFVQPTDFTTRLSHIVEIYKENGTWGIRKIADHSGLVWLLFADETNATATSQSQLGNELQLAKTADGSTLLVKWIDFVTYSINGADQNSSDVFVSVRTKGGNWTSEPMNVSQTPLLNKITWVPNIIPSNLQNIPLLSIQSMPTATETDPVVTNIDIQRRIVGRTQYIMMSHFNADAAVGVNEQSAGDTYKVLGPVTPNPISGQGNIQFTLPSAGHVTVELYDVMGQKVLTAANGMMSAGTQNVSINTTSLPAGAYYYTLKWNGTTETRMLSVVR